MPTYYVEDYDGERNDDAAAPVVLAPVTDDGVQAKVIEAPEPKHAEKSDVQVETKGGGE